MTHCVPLRDLPKGFRIPEELQGRILFHPETQQLEFEGFMSKNDFDRLLKLDNDLGYQRALEQLFHKCSFTDERQSRREGTVPLTRMPWFVIAVALVAVVSITVLGMRAW